MARLLVFSALAATAAAVIRVSCIGDSITAGVCSGPDTHGYPEVLQNLLGSNYAVSNFGNSGKTMLINGICGPPPAGNCSYWSTPSWPQALASTPDIVTIALGTNDAKRFNWWAQGNGTAGTGNYTTQFVTMVQQLKALNPVPLVFLIVPPPLYSPFPYDMDPVVINEILPSLIPSIAAQAGAEPEIISAFNALGGADLSQPGITCDGCHPIDRGYMEFAQAVESVISKAVAEGRLARRG